MLLRKPVSPSFSTSVKQYSARLGSFTSLVPLPPTIIKLSSHRRETFYHRLYPRQCRRLPNLRFKIKRVQGMTFASVPIEQRNRGKSYFQQTICLEDWWLIKAENSAQGRGLAVAGSTSREKQGVRVFSSVPILKRYDTFTLETTDGICVMLNGLINKNRTLENGFPSDVCDYFSIEFPSYWKEYCDKILNHLIAILEGEQMPAHSPEKDLGNQTDEIIAGKNSLSEKAKALGVETETKFAHATMDVVEFHDDDEDGEDDGDDDGEDDDVGRRRPFRGMMSCNPLYYEVVLKPYHQYKLTLKRRFTKTAGLMGKERVEVVGKYHSRSVRLNNTHKDKNRMDLGPGWCDFQKINRLVYGKTYSIEFNPNTNAIHVKDLT